MVVCEGDYVWLGSSSASGVLVLLGERGGHLDVGFSPRGLRSCDPCACASEML